MHNAKHRQRSRSKCHAELVHFRTRCLQRVGMILTQDYLKEYCFGKNRVNVVPHVRQSLTKTKWLYTHTDGRRFIIVYDKPRKRFVTIIPFEEKEEGQ